MKIPGIFADIGVAWLLFVIGRRWGGELLSRARLDVPPETVGLTAAAVYLFNPGVIFDSAVWGQVDSVGSLVLLATIYALGRGWTEVAALGAVVGMLVKFQFAFLIPIVAIVGIKRHLLGRSSDPSHAGHRDGLRVITSLAVGVVSMTALMLPFGMFLYAPLAGGDPNGLLGILPEADPSTSLIGKLIEASGTYVGLSVNAINLWRNPWSGLGDTLSWGDDTTVAFVLGGASVNWQQVGALLFGIAAIVALWVVARRDEMRGLLLASLILAIAFFALPTRVHERYLFPALAIGALLLFSGRAWPWIYGALSLSFFANVYWVYTEDWSFTDRIMNPGLNGQPMAQDGFLQSTLFTDGGIWLLAFMITVTFITVVWLAVRWSLTEPAPARTEMPAVVPPPTDVAVPAEDWERPPSRRRGWLTPNPADVYFKEPIRRLDRRDKRFATARRCRADGHRPSAHRYPQRPRHHARG